MIKMGTYIRWRCVALEVGLDGAVLLVEESEIRNEVLDDVGVWQWVDSALFTRVCGNTAQASQSIDTINVHRTGTADSFSA